MKDLLPIARNQAGQSLVELLAALSVIVLVLFSLVKVATLSLNNSSYSKQKAQAAKYAQEGIEKTRAYRDANIWSTFSNSCPSLQATLNLPALPSPFSRTITCVNIDSTKSEVKVIISWTDNKGTHTSKTSSYFTDQFLWK